MILSAYFSHPIRGTKGPDATAQDIIENCEHCSEVAHQIERETGITLYIPADHDEVINLAFTHGHITERGILEADCRILAKRDFVLAYAREGHVSRGMKVEIEHALAIDIPVFIFEHWNDASGRFKIFIRCTEENYVCGLCGQFLLDATNTKMSRHNYLTENH